MLKEVTYDHVLEAASQIYNHIGKAPLVKSLALSNNTTNLFLKLESSHLVKSFKIRGALNKIMSLTPEEKEKGVISISSGNHGIAVSYAGSLLGIKNTKVIVPATTPKAKTNQIRHYGAEVIEYGENYDEAHVYGQRLIDESGMTFVDAFDKDYLVYAGQGTCGYEIIEQNPDIDVILVPVGGGGLVTGVSVGARGLKKDVKIIGVQPEASPAMVASIRDNEPYYLYPTDPTVCEALAGGIGELAFQMRDSVYDDILLVSEESIRRATAHMVLNERFVAEPSGSATVAAFMDNKERFKGLNVATVISGGNIDGKLLKEIIEEYKY